jgi:hypothetical protein
MNGYFPKKASGILAAFLAITLSLPLSECSNEGTTGPSGSGTWQQSRIKEQERRDLSGRRIDLWVYDYSGGRQKFVHFDSLDRITDSVVYELNPSGSIAKALRYSASGTPTGYTDYAYDGKQTLASDTTYDMGNIMLYYIRYEFSGGNKIRSEQFVKTGPTSYQTYEYDDAGLRVKSIVHDTSGKTVSYTLYGYSHGLPDTLRSYNAGDLLIGIRTFKMENEPSPYDYMAYGNW